MATDLGSAPSERGWFGAASPAHVASPKHSLPHSVVQTNHNHSTVARILTLGVIVAVTVLAVGVNLVALRDVLESAPALESAADFRARSEGSRTEAAQRIDAFRTSTVAAKSWVDGAIPTLRSPDGWTIKTDGGVELAIGAVSGEAVPTNDGFIGPHVTAVNLSSDSAINFYFQHVAGDADGTRDMGFIAGTRGDYSAYEVGMYELLPAAVTDLPAWPST